MSSLFQKTVALHDAFHAEEAKLDAIQAERVNELADYFVETTGEDAILSAAELGEDCTCLYRPFVKTHTRCRENNLSAIMDAIASKLRDQGFRVKYNPASSVSPIFVSWVKPLEC